MLDYIYRRRSIRKFDPNKPVEAEKINELLKAAMAAPTARNNRGWKFIVVQDRARLDELAEMYPNASMLKSATLCIVPVANMNTWYYQQDLSNATMNILLAAPELGLGTCWCGINPDRHPDAALFFGTPKEWWIFALIAVGYPAEDKPNNTWFEEQHIFNEKWGKS